MASLSYEDTLIVPKLPIHRPRARPLSARFGPPERTVRWPWLVAAALWIAAAATPLDLDRELRLSTHAQQLLLSNQ